MIKMLTILVMMGFFADYGSSKLLLVSVKDKASDATEGNYKGDYSENHGSDYGVECSEADCQVTIQAPSYNPRAAAQASAGANSVPSCCTKENTKFKMTQDDNEVNLNPDKNSNNETTKPATAPPATTAPTTAPPGSKHGNGRGSKRKGRWHPYPPPPGYYGRGPPPPHPKYMV